MSVDKGDSGEDERVKPCEHKRERQFLWRGDCPFCRQKEKEINLDEPLGILYRMELAAHCLQHEKLRKAVDTEGLAIDLLKDIEVLRKMGVAWLRED